MSDLARVALVTGAAKRIGAAIARALHADGYALALHYRNSALEMQALADELETARPGSTLVLQAELAEVERLPLLVARTVERFGRLDALVNNASAYYATPVGTATPQQWDALFASNARAPFFLSQAAAPHLKHSAGSIVSIADIFAQRPLPEHTLYCMAKAALVMMTQSLARELGPHVRVERDSRRATSCGRKTRSRPRPGRCCANGCRCNARARRRTSSRPCAGCWTAMATSTVRSSPSTAAARCSCRAGLDPPLPARPAWQWRS